MNIDNILKENCKFCSGCGACVNICPKRCIVMETDEEGFLYPKVDIDICIHCEKCRDICPNLGTEEEHRDMSSCNLFAVCNKSDDIRKLSTSGGVFPALAEYIIEKGGCVCGVTYDKSSKSAVHVMVDSKDGIPALQKSKYTQSYAGETYSLILKELRKNRDVLFTGTPCQVAGLKAFLGKEYETLVTMDIACFGVPSPKAFYWWLVEIEYKNNSKVENIEFKFKDRGWKKSPYSIRLRFSNGEERIIHDRDNIFMRAYLDHGLLFRRSCAECKYKGFAKRSDITVGDFWGVSEEYDDDKGTSFVLCHTDKGKKIFDNISNHFRKYEMPLDTAFDKNYGMMYQCLRSENAHAFLRELGGNKSFSALFNQYTMHRVNGRRTETDEDFREVCRKKLKRSLSLQGERQLYIYGASRGGEILKNVLDEARINIDGFIDARSSPEFREFMCYPVRKLKDVTPDKAYILVSLKRYDMSVLNDLMSAGFTQKDFFYFFETETHNREDIIYKGCKVGRYTYGYDSLVSEFPIVESIGRFCSINWSAKVVINHPVNRVTTSSFLYRTDGIPWEYHDFAMNVIKKYMNDDNAPYMWFSPAHNKPVTIGNDVWIGANVVILPGIHVADGAVLGSGAVITNDVGPYEIVGGVPAHVIKKRFSDEEISMLEEIKWWDWDIDKISRNLELLFEPTKLFEAFRNGLI